MELKTIAHFDSPFSSKFGIPRQSGLVESLKGKIIFEQEYRNPDFIRGIEGVDYLWIIWGFSANKHEATSPVVRPPVLGGNEKRGVFATRSPFRPNPIGLSSVMIDYIDYNSPVGPTIYVKGSDLMDGTPIYDIKPYLPYTDSHPEARGGFSAPFVFQQLNVSMNDSLKNIFSDDDIQTLRDILAQDPRPRYINDPQRIYGMPFLNYDIRFRIADNIVEIVEAVRLV
ncbi:MAG: tRNA (N6-threonylcarbamoyladenosine(37)-N6)-methyltransferase TrmO [Marinilabiliaceae bacterium]|nr:tRNA (N6-threonylcarbamoyladenosine(37)-N6)-methyltransferase TrmO [Marinilabiliaceae bacterium]